MLNPRNFAVGEGVVGRRDAALQVHSTTAVAACWHRTAMSLVPDAVSEPWLLAGGAICTPARLDTQEVATSAGAVTFVKLEKLSLIHI